MPCHQLGPSKMIVLGLGLLLVAVLVLALQVYWGWRFALSLSSSTNRSSEQELPYAAVVLCLRGADSSLAACLQALLNQDYPCYQLHIVIDRVDDPANEIVSRIVGNRPPNWVRVSYLTDPLPTCSLKVCALMQTIGGLDETIQVVALVDADVIPYRHWLRDLVGPLVDPNIGATTGFRWYVPKGSANLWTRVSSALECRRV